jgi:DnaJ-class molecular chaperone
MDFYKILNINKNASSIEIKRAYKKMALKYHPDKNKSVNSINKFHQIKLAYDTLIDNSKREEYDSMTNFQKEQISNMIEEYIINKSPEYSCFYNNVINSLYNNKDEFQDDINNFNFKGIYQRFRNKINKNYKNWFEQNEFDEKNKKVINIKCTLLQKYKDMYKKIKIKNKQIVIPLRENQILYDKYIININTDLDPVYDIINDNDLIVKKNVSLYDYIYGGRINFIHLDNSEIELDYNSNISKNPIYKINKKGLPYTYIDNSSDLCEYKISDSIIKRGDLYIHLNVTDIDQYKKKFNC